MTTFLITCLEISGGNRKPTRAVLPRVACQKTSPGSFYDMIQQRAKCDFPQAQAQDKSPVRTRPSSNHLHDNSCSEHRLSYPAKEKNHDKPTSLEPSAV